MLVLPLAFDSLGVRSQSTFIQTDDLNIHIDPAVALAPRRFGLPPHRVEVERLYELASAVEEYLRDSDVVIITHYHYDHHDPGRVISIENYRGKTVILKDPHERINVSQRIRASRFIKRISNYARKVEIGDSREYVFGKTKISFSKPVPHGVDDKLGYVIEVLIDDGEKSVLYTSDVEGPVLKEQVDFILKHKPDLLIVDGPLTYMLGYRFSMEDLNASIRYLKNIINVMTGKVVLLDHHVLRDRDYREKLSEVYSYAKAKKVSVISAAEFLGKQVDVLEVRRRELYEKEYAPGKILFRNDA